MVVTTAAIPLTPGIYSLLLSDIARKVRELYHKPTMGSDGTVVKKELKKGKNLGYRLPKFL